MDEPKNNEWNSFHLRSKKLSGPSQRWNQFLTTIYSNQQKSFFLKFWKPKIIIECEKKLRSWNFETKIISVFFQRWQQQQKS